MLRAPEYKSVFGLTENPFNPASFADADARALDGIHSYPLALDEQPGLLPLFVHDAGPFRRLLKRFEQRLAAGGYTGDRSVAGGRSMVFRIVGPEGSGKSTLANLLARRLHDCVADGDLIVLKRDIRPLTLDATLADVRKAVMAGGERSCCLIFDEVRLDVEDRLHELFEELRRDRAVVMFEIVHFAQDIRRPRLSSRVYADELNTTWLAPEHAAAFVGARIDLFRCPEVGARFVGDLATFPFDAKEVAEVAAAADGHAETLTLRILNRLLNDAIELEGAQRAGDSVPELDDAELRERTIDLREIYAEAIAEPLRDIA